MDCCPALPSLLRKVLTKNAPHALAMGKRDRVGEFEVAIVDAHEDGGDGAGRALAYLKALVRTVVLPCNRRQDAEHLVPALFGDLDGLALEGVLEALVRFIDWQDDESS